MQQVEINGKAWPVNFGTAAIMRLEQMTGRAFYDLIFSLLPTGKDSGGDDSMAVGIEIISNAPVTVLAQILYCGMWGGAKKAKEKFELEFDDLLSMLDECDTLLEPLSQGFALVVESLDGKAKKKTEKATKAKQ